MSDFRKISGSFEPAWTYGLERRLSGMTLCRKFTEYLSLVRGCSERTVELYVFEVGQIMNWIGVRGKIISEMEKEDWIEWRQGLSKFKHATIQLKVASAKAYCRFLLEQGTIKYFTMPKFVVKVKDQEPTNVPNARQFLEMRKKMKKWPLQSAAFEILAGTGLRLKAMLTLRLQHLRLDCDKPHIVVDSEMSCKGSRAGIVPMTPYTAKKIRELLKIKTERSLFVLPRFITENVVFGFLKKVEPKGLHIHPHSLRHFYVCMMYWRNLVNQRFNVVWVRDAVGHSNIGVTDRYLRLANMICDSDELWEKWAYGASLSAVKQEPVVSQTVACGEGI